MDNQLEAIAKTYDKAIEFGSRGIDLYKDLPDYITNDPDFQRWNKDCENGDSGSKEIKDYLMRLIRI